MRIGSAQAGDENVVSYLKEDIFRNALDLWYFERQDPRLKLHVCISDEGTIGGHLAIYDTPEATYANLGGVPHAAKELLDLVPREKAVLTTTEELLETMELGTRYDAIFPNDFMMVKRGDEKLRNPGEAVRLSTKDALEYSSFGSSFNVPPPSLPIAWINEILERDLVFGIFAYDGRLASVASLAAWLPEVSVIMGVETKTEFRRKGFGAGCVSTAVQEGLKRSNSCSLFVRSDNEAGIELYKSLGFRKVGGELWIDIGSGLIP